MQHNSIASNNVPNAPSSSLLADRMHHEDAISGDRDLSAGTHQEEPSLDDITPYRVLDAVGLSCPMPLLRTQKEIQSLAPRQVLMVLSTCPGARTSLPTWSTRAGHLFLGSLEKDGILRTYIRKG